MSGYEPTPEDTAAMRASGNDFREYLRSEMNRGRDRAKPPTKTAAQPPPGHRPGQWPPGTSPPGPPEPIPPEEVTRALAEYRQWLDDGQPPGQYRCECTACQQLPGDRT